MAVQEGPTSKRYTTNGVATTFTVPFLLFDADDLQVSINSVIVTTGYIVTGVGNPESTITFSSPPPAGGSLLLELIMPFQRLNDYQENGDFLATTVNTDFDRIWQAMKQLFRFFGRALSLGPFDVDGSGSYRAKGNRIQDLANPINDQDAATNIWVRQLLTNGAPVGDYVHESMLYPPATGGTDTRGVDFTIHKSKGALRFGGSDMLPTNDERGFWAGLPSQNAWGNSLSIGLYTVAFNRNGASLGAYSTTFGHDCVTYGVASVAGGAGSCTGTPSNPTSTNFEGYCAFAWGKNVQALGQKSAALCEETLASARASLASGFGSIAAPGPNTGPAGIASEGIGAHAMGYQCKAYGDGSVSVGSFLSGSDGTVVIGSGINPGTVLSSSRAKAVAIGANSNVPSITVAPGPGTAFARGPVGIHTESPRQLVEILQYASNQVVAIRTEVPGTKGNLTFQGTSNAGASLDLFRIEVESTNGGSAQGILRIFVNGSGTASVTIGTDGVIDLPTTGLKVSGSKVIGARQSAITNSDGSLASTSAAVNNILTALRAHGLIAP